MSRSERHITELYRDDPERADAIIFGRRGFLQGAGLAAMSAAVGATIPFAINMPAGLFPAALAQDKPASPVEPKTLEFPGKAPGLVVLGEKPLVAETPAHLLDDDTTPTDKLFIRNNGQIPEPPADPGGWKIRIDGEVNTPFDMTLGELRSKFQPVTLRMVLECGGNGRSYFVPQARGNQWTTGGVGCPEWTGVRLRDVLKAAGVKPSAVYTGHHGADPHLSGDASKEALSRGVPIAKAMEEHSLIAFEVNGEDLPNIHGFPVRLIIPGWPGSVSSKWLNRIEVRDKEHDGHGMGGFSYRLMKTPIVPGGEADEANTRIMESMPVRSIITGPAHGAQLSAGTREIALRGAAWAGDQDVKAVDVSIDFGRSWLPMRLAAPKNRYDWRRWTGKVTLPTDGYYEVWSRATDDRGAPQPHAAGDWNPQGYGANPFHRIAVLAA